MNLRARDSLNNIYCFDVFDIEGRHKDDEDYFFVAGVEPRLICRTLERSTGLKDKNGVEIYEGDIVKYKTDKPKAIEYKNAQFQMAGSILTYPSSIALTNDNMEIVGNIHTNPELLNEAS